MGATFFPIPVLQPYFCLYLQFNFTVYFMKFTYYGQSCFTVDFGGKILLFDPFISGNPLAKDIDINSIKADYILISHGHGDHIADLITIAGNTGALVISNFEIINWVEKQGYTHTHPMNFGTFTFDFGKVYFVPAAHSSVLPDGSNGGSAGGFVIKNDVESFYYSGDTCLTMDMQLIPRYAKLNVAMLPIGGNFTMDAEQASIAAEFIQCDKIIGLHYDTFGFIKIDHEEAKDIFKKAGKELILVNIGDTISI